MKIVSKEMKRDGTQSIVYLVDDNGKPLKADIVNNDGKKELINQLLAEYFTPDDWVNNKESLLKNVEEITYENYINQ